MLDNFLLFDNGEHQEFLSSYREICPHRQKLNPDASLESFETHPFLKRMMFSVSLHYRISLFKKYFIEY